ncbi:ead/Ea22-like family protein [Enterobacter roggenkampii]|uniref:ead/Ea22-like family protein n=1 Tax=Enterobacter roggenkampii TaxID=1812935 RepID=UPI001BDFE7F0|nr:ead/Ea22-like family protein [Enterobacter roggenkampii]WCF42174.1 ead/Ea22-like family protein [Enterobacter roggenkampii]
MSNINKQALRETAERASTDNHTQDEWFHYLRCSTPATVLALLDELEASEKLNAELMEKQRLIDICQGQGLEHRIAAEKRAEAAEKRIAELERKEQHSERQSVIDALAGSGEEWSDIEEYMQKWDAERASAAGKGE